MDEADQGNVQAEQLLELQLRMRHPTGPRYIGVCWNCEEPLAYPHRWCNAECRDDWIKYRGVLP